ncbi:MAG: hypothetical protein QXO27_03760, partial [Candidatus Aenigmatarchaeota archaeon]
MKMFNNVNLGRYGKLVFATILLSSIIIFSSMALAATDTVTVDVSIATISQITVTPETLTFSGINPGQSGEEKSLNIRNTGSVNVTNIYAYVDTLTDETTRPYGSDDP